MSRLLSVVHQKASSTLIASYTYDARGNRTSVTDALQDPPTSFDYDVMNRLKKITQPGNATTQFVYDTRGRRTSVTDPNNKTTQYGYDDADRLTSVTDAALNMTSYQYDTENHLASITDAMNPFRITGFTYDSLGRVTQVTFPSTLTENYTYDAVGNLKTKRDRKNQTITYNYDNLDRLTSKVYPDTTSVSYIYDNDSRLTQAVDPTGTYAFSYDNLGRLTQTTTNYSFLASRTLTVNHTYDAASNRVTMSGPETGPATSYVYDTLNRLTSLTDFNNVQFGFSYDALGRRTGLTRPSAFNTTYTYDTLSRLLSVVHQKTGSTLSYSYSYDAAGNRTSGTRYLQAPGFTTSQVTSSYSYDALYELTKVMQGATTTESYSYDTVGNRLSSLSVPSYTYNASNQLLTSGVVTWGYDANGSVSSRTDSGGTITGTWDFENRGVRETLPNAATINFKYDPFGRRIQKSSASGTTNYVYDGDNIVEELSSTGTSVARYAQSLGIDEPLAMYRGGAGYVYHADGLGSIGGLTDANGNIAATYTYDSFGNLTASTGTVTNPYRYTAREFDTETGIYYYRARYYFQGIGRFASEDRRVWTEGSENVINAYVYVNNNPAASTDPLGLYSLKVGIPYPDPILDTFLYCTAGCYQGFLMVTSTSEPIPQHRQGSPHRGWRIHGVLCHVCEALGYNPGMPCQRHYYGLNRLHFITASTYR